MEIIPGALLTDGPAAAAAAVCVFLAESQGRTYEQGRRSEEASTLKSPCFAVRLFFKTLSSFPLNLCKVFQLNFDILVSFFFDSQTQFAANVKSF